MTVIVLAVPGYISRSVAGSYDNEGIAIFALQFTYFLWVGSYVIYIFITRLMTVHIRNEQYMYKRLTMGRITF